MLDCKCMWWGGRCAVLQYAESGLWSCAACQGVCHAEVQTALLHLQMLSEWNPEDPAVLALLLQQVLEQFVVHSSNVLSQHQRLQFELHTLEESEQYSRVEVLCLPSEEVSWEVGRWVEWSVWGAE